MFFFPLCDERGTWLILVCSTAEGNLPVLGLFHVLQQTAAPVEILLSRLSRSTELFSLYCVFRVQYKNSKTCIKTQLLSVILLSHKPQFFPETYCSRLGQASLKFGPVFSSSCGSWWIIAELWGCAGTARHRQDSFGHALFYLLLSMCCNWLKIKWKMLFPNRLKEDMSTVTTNKIRRDFW